jgi:ferredoxin
MAFVITDECLSCGTCAANCPVEAIDMGDLHYEIDVSKCVECGTCAANCPAEAIVSE